MANYKLNEDDDTFLQTPDGAVLVASGSDGAQSWLERDTATTVRIVVASVGVAVHDGATLEAAIEIDGARAAGRAGPSAADSRMQALQSVQVVLKPDQRLHFTAQPNASGVRVLKTVVYTSDIKG